MALSNTSTIYLLISGPVFCSASTSLAYLIVKILGFFVPSCLFAVSEFHHPLSSVSTADLVTKSPNGGAVRRTSRVARLHSASRVTRLQSVPMGLHPTKPRENRLVNVHPWRMGEPQFPLSLLTPAPVDIGDGGQPIFEIDAQCIWGVRRKNICILRPKSPWTSLNSCSACPKS